MHCFTKITLRQKKHEAINLTCWLCHKGSFQDQKRSTVWGQMTGVWIGNHAYLHLKLRNSKTEQEVQGQITTPLFLTSGSSTADIALGSKAWSGKDKNILSGGYWEQG